MIEPCEGNMRQQCVVGGILGLNPIHRRFRPSIIDEMEEPLMTSTQVVTFANGLSGVRKWDASLFEDSLIGDRKVRIEVDGTTRDIPIQINASDVKRHQL